MRSALRVLKADSRGGRRAVERLLSRGELVLDPKVSRRAEKIVDEVRRGGDAALLARVRELDGVAASAVADLALAPLPGDEDRPAGPSGSGRIRTGFGARG